MGIVKMPKYKGKKQTYKTGKYNRLLSDGNYSYEYDREGNRISKTDKEGKTTKYTWDNRNRLIKVTTTASEIEYLYDYQNRLVERTENKNNQQYFVHDNWQIILQFDNKEPTPVHRYLWGIKQDELICNKDNWVLSDHLNTIRDVVKLDDNVVDHLEYNSFGKLISVTKNTSSMYFAYTGELTDRSSELQWNINRWYDSNVGRWVSEDPIGYNTSDFNISMYVKNAPMKYNDYLGLWLTGHNLPYVSWGQLSREQRYPGTVRGSDVGTKKCKCGNKNLESTMEETEYRFITQTPPDTCNSGAYDGLLGDTPYMYCGVFSLYRRVETTYYKFECRLLFVIASGCAIKSGYRVCETIYESNQRFGKLEARFTGEAEPMHTSSPVDPGDILSFISFVITVGSLL
jgi:RHS repeat-associated protein